MILEILTTALLVAVTLALIVGYAAAVHGIWVVGEHVKVRLAARMGVDYRRQDSPLTRWIRRDADEGETR